MPQRHASPRQQRNPAPLQRQARAALTTEGPYLRGSVTRLVNTHGSSWGKLEPADGSRSIFFNLHSLQERDDFQKLEVGSQVSFQEVTDQVNGSHAVNMTPTDAEAPAPAEKEAHIADVRR